MLLWLTDYLSEFVSGFAVFQYLTFRTMVSVVTALLMSLLIGPVMIARLARAQIGQTIRDDGPASHFSKAGTPTMGGALILVILVVTTLLWGDLTNRYIWLVILVTLSFGAIGWVDDYLKISRKNTEGLIARWKYFWQSVFALMAAVYLYTAAQSPVETTLFVPFFKSIALPLGIGFVLLSYLMIVGMSNAVNLTDGLDGLAIMPAVMVGAALGLIAYVSGNTEFSSYLQIPYVAGAGELAVFCGALIGAGLGFLWFNAPPAMVFMGDTGSLSMGGTIGAIAVATKHELILTIIGGIFVLEALSVFAQVISFKLTGKRIFKMAPIHHHFEQKGWSESTIVIRFWIIAIILALIGLASLKLR